MKYLIIIMCMLLPAAMAGAQEKQPRAASTALFTWDLLWAGSWEESKNLHNRGDVRLGVPPLDLLARGLIINRNPLNFQLDPPWGDSSQGITGAAAGMYHPATGSRLLYGILDEWGLPARIRYPWLRSAPFAENHKPVIADLRTTVSSTKEEEIYLYVSSPHLEVFHSGFFPEMTIRAFSSAQITANGVIDGNKAESGNSGGGVKPAFSGGFETVVNKTVELLVEGFYTSAELAPRKSSSWFSDPPPLPARDFRLAAAGVLLNTELFLLSSDIAWSEVFAWGTGMYMNAGVRFKLPRSLGAGAKPGPWSISLAFDNTSDRYTGRDGTSPGSGLRAAGKIEWKGQRSSLFRANTTLRGAGPEEPFNRSSSGIYYRTGNIAAGEFPLRLSRISFNADRNAVNWAKIQDGLDGTLGLSLRLPPMMLPQAPASFEALLPASSRKTKNPRPKLYPLGLNLTGSVNWLGSADAVPSPYPFSLDSAFPALYDSSKISCELLWSPGIVQLRTRWGYTAYAKKDDQWDGSFSAAIRLRHGRFSAKIAWPTFPEKWNCTLSWRVEQAGGIPSPL